MRPEFAAGRNFFELMGKFNRGDTVDHPPLLPTTSQAASAKLAQSWKWHQDEVSCSSRHLKSHEMRIELLTPKPTSDSWHWIFNPIQIHYKIQKYYADGLLANRMLDTTFLMASPHAFQSFFYATKQPQKKRFLKLMNNGMQTYFVESLEKSLQNNVTRPKALQAIRDIIERILGPSTNLEILRSKCRKIYLTNHPDKIGMLDYEDEELNQLAQTMYRLLDMIKDILNNPEFAALLYPPNKPPSRLYQQNLLYPLFFCSPYSDGDL